MAGVGTVVADLQGAGRRRVGVVAHGDGAVDQQRIDFVRRDSPSAPHVVDGLAHPPQGWYRSPLRIVRSPRGHIAAVLGCLKQLGLHPSSHDSPPSALAGRRHDRRPRHRTPVPNSPPPAPLPHRPRLIPPDNCSNLGAVDENELTVCASHGWAWGGKPPWGTRTGTRCRAIGLAQTSVTVFVIFIYELTAYWSL